MHSPQQETACVLIHADEPGQANRLAGLCSHYGYQPRILDRRALLQAQGEAAGLMISCRQITAELRLALKARPDLPRVLFCERIPAREQESLMGVGVWLVPHGCGEREKIAAWLSLARQLTLLLAEGAEREQGLTRRLEERRLVERAKGRLMRQHGLGEEEAYQLLRRAAMAQSKSLGELARQLLAG
ncbi:hypothetical protein ATO46_16475 [Aeromonas schubertii]|uniref:ANTAR domain-containing response regulator n=1 Tax=Aeromonas schubertii TaxID=652 RepID=UPI00067ECBE4|nr:ANTAR domain-containing protein [Aeromonas schubertii]KUE80045.1 hypothetical protein ATO46_16475 [Aeromonas schubertii]